MSVKFIAVAFFLLLAGSATAQSNHMDRTKYRVRTVEGDRLVIGKAIYDENGVTGTGWDGTDVNVPRDRISSLYVYRGTHARQGLWIGMGLGVLSSFLQIARRHSDDDRPEPTMSDDLRVFLVMTGGGTLVGLGAGALLPKWELVDSGSTWSQQSRPIPGLTLTLNF